MIAPNFNFTTNIDEVFPYLVSMSTVRSVSGFAMEVLKLDPFETVNHWPFLMEHKQVNLELCKNRHCTAGQ